ncbi:hypothetical protein BV25DRAFT_961919 [Artomyces pyxidatus]|uniref:Uncharacterized protein n=1 Tax=Artomyces pyxidatus TaxID=48021 RepID=A0ACB8SWC2_9AGAM|nr:hypothetical protein BV25DRAFT_961919 [Artomyces pyxidatus]
MSNSTGYGPVGETATDIFLERTFLASGYLTAFGYGVQLVLYWACVRVLWKSHTRGRRPSLFLIAYITVLCAMNTIWTGTSAYGLQLTFIDNRNYPGGPFGFLLVEFSLPVNVLSLASYIIGNILADALMLWRCWVIWAASIGRKANLVMVVPVLTLFGSLAMAIIYAIETASPAGFFSQVTVDFGIVFFALSMSLNILLTLMIVGRMWADQGRSSTARRSHYTSASTIFIESAALYAVSSLLLLVTYSIGNPINQIFLGLSPSVQMIANYLIIYRVAKGRAWSTDLRTEEGALVFPDTFQLDSRTIGATGVGEIVFGASNQEAGHTDRKSGSESIVANELEDGKQHSSGWADNAEKV